MEHAYALMVFVILLGFAVFGEYVYCIAINQQLLSASPSCYQLQQNIQC
jgi:hypothetical protein